MLSSPRGLENKRSFIFWTKIPSVMSPPVHKTLSISQAEECLCRCFGFAYLMFLLHLQSLLLGQKIEKRSNDNAADLNHVFMCWSENKRGSLQLLVPLSSPLPHLPLHRRDVSLLLIEKLIIRQEFALYRKTATDRLSGLCTQGYFFFLHRGTQMLPVSPGHIFSGSWLMGCRDGQHVRLVLIFHI